MPQIKWPTESDKSTDHFCGDISLPSGKERAGHQKLEPSKRRSLKERACSHRSISVKVDHPDEFLGALKKHVQWVVVVGKIPSLKAIASELFIGKIDIEFESDPEIPDCHYVVFTVNLTDDPHDISDLRRKWYHQTSNLLKENADKVRLSINVDHHR